MKTTRIDKNDIKHNWYIIDAKGKTLGRLSTKISTILMGKNKVTYQPDIDNGDGVIVINAKDIKVTGNKLLSKMYYSHSGYIGNLKETSLDKMLEKNPSKVITLAVKRMLPKNKLGRKMLTRLKVYADSNHKHKAQNPIEINL
ncbi:MAG: 50S ribosomal protein L13 [bacterium]|uniref:Large ribosomal subunit protein uL13 n=2 Tax=Bacteria candidate phyla TaxID=1783234 RepID=A0A101I270_UNCT6|nr:MAG: 50S ribosomal protein L13 [candidate division TA06 bacterium 32_111]KUK87275.1 MAG: 50S ribosomal protein L13 [candidate division TA06 bacterium 34_109]MDI6700467.1 50S ribosomal protein L13 [bacterium]HAF07591.1 50S ribosomal protein L13 [candidate division WOR-3 bacterium]HCP16142.1 50S ribosomal protein L13 [candidate division WOR-3 bacterium]